MNGKRPNTGLTIIVLFALAVFWQPVSAQAENIALLIGISEYEHPMIVPNLEGPQYDLKDMQQVLSRQGFDNITVLLNAQATRQNILNAIRNIEKSSQPGDRIVIYFSGHGTSRHAAEGGLPLPHTSGALVPYDFTYSENDSVEAVMSRLIVGRSDLKPILARLDKGRSILVIFDSCYSGSAVRAVKIFGAGSSRYVKIQFRSLKGGNSLLDDQDIGDFDENTKIVESYPYKNIFYISAASEFEVAQDITQNDIKYNKIPVFNNEPHGVLTDAVLKAISGQEKADLNNNGSIAMEELYQSIIRTVKNKLKFMQTPQSLPVAGPDADRLRDMAFFNAGDHPTQVDQPAHDIKIQVDGRLSKIKKCIAHANDLTLSNDSPDLRIISDKGKIILTLADYRQISMFEDQTPDRITQRTRQYAKVFPLIRLSYPCQRNNVAIRLESKLSRSIFKPGEEIGFSIESEKKAFILVINIDPKGLINVLYPFYPEEMAPQPAGRKLNLSNLFKIVPPHGTEIVKAFALTQKPKGFEAIIGKEAIVPGSKDHLNLYKMVFENASTRKDVAQDTITVTSYENEDFTDPQ